MTKKYPKGGSKMSKW